jgi:hypothetical protein
VATDFSVLSNVHTVLGALPLPGVKRPGCDVDYLRGVDRNRSTFLHLNLPFRILCSRNVISTGRCVIDPNAV